MTSCQELFSLLGIMFPNHVRALITEGRLDGIAGKFDPRTLQSVGRMIEQACPEHAAFQTGGADGHEITCRQTMIRSREHANFFVRYIHVDHGPGVCRTIATTSGPLDKVDEIGLTHPGPLPLTEKELAVALSIAAGKSVRQIAQNTDHSVHTIRNQLKSALRSTGSHSQLQIALLVRDYLFR